MPELEESLVAPSGHKSSHNHARQHSRNKKSDPFLDLPEDIKLVDQPSPSSRSENGDQVEQSLLTDVSKTSRTPTDPSELTLWSQLVLTPINMITFILALFVVDHQQRSWRLSQHASGSQSIWDRLTQWPLLEPEPYQDPDSAAWQHKSAAADRPSPQRTGSFHGWYARKKHRAMAKLQIGDAFEMRSRVLVALIAWSFLGLLAVSYAMRRAYGWCVA